MAELDMKVVVLGIALLVVIIYAIMIWRDRNKYLEMCRPLDDKCKKLESEIQTLKSKAGEPAEKSDKKKNTKSEKQPKDVDIDALNEKIQTLKADNAKLKEKNYSLTKDNESLRKDIKTNSASNEEDQREIVAMREQNADLNHALNESKAKLNALEKLVAELKENTVKTEAENKSAERSEDDVKKIASLERENVSLQASLKEMRGELSTLRREFKSEVETARKEISESNKSLKKDLNNAVRQVSQSKKRADNNHRIYLIARAQMLLAEKRLAKYEPNYKPVMVLPTSNEAIDEVIKKFLTLEARDSRSANNENVNSLQKKIDELEAENAKLKTAASENEAASEDAFEDESLSSLVTTLDTDKKSTNENHAAPTVANLDVNTLVDLDFSSMDEEWDSL